MNNFIKVETESGGRTINIDSIIVVEPYGKTKKTTVTVRGGETTWSLVVNKPYDDFVFSLSRIINIVAIDNNSHAINPISLP
jgi:hypothetical protein